VRLRIRAGVPIAGAWTATYLGDRRDELTVDGDAVPVELPRLGSVGVLLDLAPGGTPQIEQ
jgi:hypothetical protein